jgi:hypothetical protein
LRAIEARLGIDRERRMRRPFAGPGLVPAISKWRHGDVKGVKKWLSAESSGGGDQQNVDGPDSQYDIEDSESKETVSSLARAGR